MKKNIVLGLFSVCMGVFIGPALSPAAIVNDAGAIVAKHSGKCMNVSGATPADGAQVIQWNCVGAGNDQWTLRPSQDAYQIVAKHSGKCLDVYGGSTANGAQVIQWGCHSGNNQLWYARPVGDYFQLVAKHSGKCLNVNGGFKYQGATLIQWPCAGADNELWTIASLPHTPILAKHSNQCLDVSGGSTATGANIIQSSCNGANDQQWTLMPYQDAYRIVAKHSGQCLDVYGGSTADGAQVIQWSCHGGANQLWYPRVVGRHYALVSKKSGKCLNVKNGTQVAGEVLIQLSCSNGDHQLWQIDAGSTTGGKWSAPIPLSLVPAAAANLPDGNLLLWSSNSRLSFGGGGQTYTAIFNPATNQAMERLVFQTGHDMFCPGTSNLSDGRILVNGGVNSSVTSIYDPVSASWSATSTMNLGRGYQANTVLPTGEVFTLGGSWSGGQGGKDGEVWSAATGWRRTPGIIAGAITTSDPGGVYRADNHGWFFSVGENKVFHAGPSRQMNWINTDSSGSITFAGIRGADNHSMNGNAVMYDIGRILKLGGAPNYERSNATTGVYDIDLSNGVTVNQTASLAYARSYHNSVVLPSGEVVAFGGQAYPIPFDDLQSVFATELWNPTTKVFTTLASSRVPRNYHSVAILMTDGRVFVGGGGLCGGCDTNHADAEIFTPPYLLNADGSNAVRPVLTQAPSSAGYGATISVSTDSSINQFALVRMSSVTHSVNNDQRRIPLTFTPSGSNSYTLNIPNDRGVAIPGYYMLFGMNGAGVPSVAKVIKIG